MFRTVAPNGDAQDAETVQYWATDDLKMTETDRQALEQKSWQIETYHRGIKQRCGIERAMVRKATLKSVTSFSPYVPSSAWKPTD